MGENLYDEKKFVEIIKILNNLPKVNTPENFEFNLLTKIQNGNFEISSRGRRFNSYFVLVPSFTLVAVAFLIFMLYPSADYEIENLLIAEPQIRNELTANNGGAKEFEIPAVENTGLVQQQTVQNRSSANYSPKYRVLVKSNDVVIKERIPYPFDNKASLDLDNVIVNKPAATVNQLPNTELAAFSRSKFDFNGFFFRVHDKTVDALKAKLDSLKVRKQE